MASDDVSHPLPWRLEKGVVDWNVLDSNGIPVIAVPLDSDRRPNAYEILSSLVTAANAISSVRCLVLGCENRSNQGAFVGELCKPCHEFLTTGLGVHSQAYRNAIDLSIKALMKNSHLEDQDSGK